jgi:dihydrofolate reductase
VIGLIWAEAHGGVIGNQGDIPWDLPEDLAHFARITAGATVLMGRKTWDSLPAAHRPLSGRRNLVVTRDRTWSEPGAEAFQSVATALTAAGDADLWVIGGAAVYEQTIHLAERLHVTVVDEVFRGDTVAPTIGFDFRIDLPVAEELTSKNGLRFRHTSYTRIRN